MVTGYWKASGGWKVTGNAGVQIAHLADVNATHKKAPCFPEAAKFLRSGQIVCRVEGLGLMVESPGSMCAASAKSPGLRVARDGRSWRPVDTVLMFMSPPAGRINDCFLPRLQAAG
jgi:hypothetical protein